MANTALSAPAAHAACLRLTLESTLRMKWTVHRWYLASGSIEFTVATSPAHRSPTTSRTPLRPRSIRLLTNCSQLALSSFMPSATPTTSRWPVSSTPIATSTLTFSTDPPHVRLCHTPSTNRYGYERSNGLLRHSSICTYTPPELVRELYFVKSVFRV